MLLSINSFMYSLGHFLESALETTLIPFADVFNWTMIILGFVGFFYWLVKQGKYNKEAANNSNQIK